MLVIRHTCTSLSCRSWHGVVYLACEVQTRTIIATREERANSGKLSHGCWCLWYSNWASCALQGASRLISRRRRRQWWLERGEGLSAVTGSSEGQPVGVVLSVTCSLLIFLYSLFLIRKWTADSSSSSCSERAILLHMRHVTPLQNLQCASMAWLDAWYPRIPAIAFRNYL